MGYVKDELLEDGTDPAPASSTPNNLYDNPVFDEEQFKVDLGIAGVGKVGVPEENLSPGITTYEEDPPLYADIKEPKDTGKQKSSKYERF